MIEAHMRKQYGATARDILNGWTWREFRVLLDADFTISSKADDDDDDDDDLGDWEGLLDRAIGRVAPERKVQVSDIGEFMARYGG